MSRAASSWRRGAWTLALTVALCGCGGGRSVAPEAPPPERIEAQPTKPRADCFWQPGHWVWDEGDGVYFWAEGGWARERQGWVWLPGTWRPVTEDGVRRWEWVPEKWVRVGEEE